MASGINGKEKFKNNIFYICIAKGIVGFVCIKQSNVCRLMLFLYHESIEMPVLKKLGWNFLFPGIPAIQLLALTVT